VVSPLARVPAPLRRPGARRAPSWRSADPASQRRRLLPTRANGAPVLPLGSSAGPSSPVAAMPSVLSLHTAVTRLYRVPRVDLLMRLSPIIHLAALAALLPASVMQGQRTNRSSGSTPSAAPTLAVVNARIWTGDPKRPWVDALAATGDRI